MSIKQKLTLGIAAIFMVTLTIVGVTYAYFVTQVRGNNGTQKVEVQTATIGSVQYVEGNGGADVTVADVFPGEKIEENAYVKTFGVTNAGDEGVLTYSLTLRVTNDNDATRQFIHSTNDATAELNTANECYTANYGSNTNSLNNVESTNNSLGAIPATCKAGKYFDNVYVTLYQTSKIDATLTDVASVTPVLSRQRVENASAMELGLNNIEIEPGASNNHYYLLVVEYEDAKANQNYETEATLSIKPDLK